MGRTSWGAAMSETAGRESHDAGNEGGDHRAAASGSAPLEKVVGQYRVLSEIGAVIAAGSDLEETLASIARLVAERLDVAWCVIYEHAPAGTYTVIACHRLQETAIDSSARLGTRHDAGDWGELEACVAGLRPSVRQRDDPGLTAAQLAQMDERRELSGMSVPLVFRGELMGLLDVGESRRARRWTRDDTCILQAAADQAAVAIVNAVASARLAQQAVTDALTGLLSERHFDEHLRQEVTRARRYGQELSLVTIDVDDFKALNDRFGRQSGDGVLVELAEILRHGTRHDVDILARCGVDELRIILPQTRANGSEPTAARNVSERIAAVVRGHGFESAEGRREVSLTVSVGVAGLGLGGYTPEELLSSAQKALYLAKHHGKDRVCVFGT